MFLDVVRWKFVLLKVRTRRSMMIRVVLLRGGRCSSSVLVEVGWIVEVATVVIIRDGVVRLAVSLPDTTFRLAL